MVVTAADTDTAASMEASFANEEVEEDAVLDEPYSVAEDIDIDDNAEMWETR